jgi:hypothetical protein
VSPLPLFVHPAYVSNVCNSSKPSWVQLGCSLLFGILDVQAAITFPASLLQNMCLSVNALARLVALPILSTAIKIATCTHKVLCVTLH